MPCFRWQYFELHFEFEENRFFEDKILTKKYHLKLEPSTTYPMNYEGPEIYKSTGLVTDQLYFMSYLFVIFGVFAISFIHKINNINSQIKWLNIQLHRQLERGHEPDLRRWRQEDESRRRNRGVLFFLWPFQVLPDGRRWVYLCNHDGLRSKW